jgi:hypothetical protein
MGRLLDRFLDWVSTKQQYEVVTFSDVTVFTRYAPFWPDEHHYVPLDQQQLPPDQQTKKRAHRPPWWRPFNILFHLWDPQPGYEEDMHDHPRWSITVCLRGRIIERTPWGERLLTPGSVVVRSRKAIHGFVVPEGYGGKTWTMFIVGRRNYPQNTYVVNRETD